MNWFQVSGAMVMVVALGAYVASLVATVKAQAAGGTVTQGHARLRVAVFGVVFIGAALFVLGASVSPVFAATLFILGSLILVFALSLRLKS